jgi:anti-anti-sigma factor
MPVAVTDAGGVPSPDMPDVTPRLTIADESGSIVLTGEIDAHTAPELADHFALLPDGDDIALDMAGVDFIDSSGLRVLIDVHQRAEEAGRRLIITRQSTPVARLIEITGLTDLLHLAE